MKRLSKFVDALPTLFYIVAFGFILLALGMHPVVTHTVVTHTVLK